MPSALPPDSGSATVARILAAARSRFQKFGYRRTAISEIARDAGIAAGTIYRHFASKQDLLRQVIEDLDAGWLVEARRALDPPGTAIERIARLGQASVDYNKRNALLNAVLDRDAEIIFAPLVDELHAKVVEQNVAMMADVLRDGIAEGSIRPIDPEKAAYVLFVAGRTLFNDRDYPYEQILPVFAQIIVEGLSPRS
jgi:AcrR family transcriptional regulator